jgi:hypothetical protein
VCGLLAADAEGENRNTPLPRRFSGSSLKVPRPIFERTSARHPPPLRLVR